MLDIYAIWSSGFVGSAVVNGFLDLSDGEKW